MKLVDINRFDDSNKTEEFLKLVADIVFQHQLRLRLSEEKLKAA